MSAVSPNLPDSPPTAGRLTRRQFFKKIAAYSAIPAIAGAYATQIEPFWPEFHEVPITIPGLPRGFDQYRITHLSDMHAGRTPFGYLQRVVEHIKIIKPDVLAVTGDLVHHNPDWVEAVSTMLGAFDIPVIVSYGNHEYGIERADDETSCADLPRLMETSLTRRGCIVLRNRSTTLNRNDDHLWFAGFDDLWFGGFDAHKGFTGVPEKIPVISLSHNPDTAETIDLHRPGLILAGHTHGGQVRLPGIGALHLNTQNQKYDKGLFQLRQSQLYVSRGAGYIRRIRFFCRPEISTCRLICA